MLNDNVSGNYFSMDLARFLSTSGKSDFNFGLLQGGGATTSLMGWSVLHNSNVTTPRPLQFWKLPRCAEKDDKKVR